jgi:hypothetical protein
MTSGAIQTKGGSADEHQSDVEGASPTRCDSNVCVCSCVCVLVFVCLLCLRVCFGVCGAGVHVCV